MTDPSLIVDGILFATHRDRALYLGTSVRDRPRWLKDNPGRWRRLEDAEEAAGQQPIESEITIEGRRYANARRVAEVFGVSPRTLSRWVAAGKGPPRIKLGRKVLFDVVKLSDWLTSRET
jgi:predicted DNA-binding transcriptional regulator AlpA